MNIFLISNMYPSSQFPYYGIFVKNCEFMLQSRGFAVNHCVIKKNSLWINKLLSYLRFFVFTFLNYHFKKYDVVYLHYISHSFFPLIFSFFHRKNKILLHIHGGDVLRQKEVSSTFFAIKLMFAKLAMRRADGIVVPSNYYKALLISKFKVRADLINVIASGGVDRNVFYPRSFVKSKVFTVGYVGRLDHGKGVDTLIHSIVIASKQIDSLQCVIVGDGQLRSKLEALTQSLGLQNIIFFIGAKPQVDLPELISSFDIFVFPTERDSESLGLVGLESMACGVPVIGSKIGGLQDYIEEGVNGYFFDPTNSIDLSQKLLMYYKLSDSDKRSLSQAALKTAECYDANIENEKLITIIKEISRET